jgi:sugar phosphate isomerase/epimerase
MELERALREYAAIGFVKFEAFTSWVQSALDIATDPAHYSDLASRYNMRFASMHLPPVEIGLGATLERAIRATEFACKLGVQTVLFKTANQELYISAAARYLDAIGGLPVTPVLQNHLGSPLSNLDDMLYVLNGIDDSRLKVLLEVGHLYSAGVSWRRACQALDEKIALVHIKDQVGTRSVPFGSGEIDLVGLFLHLREINYRGDVVVEMEVTDHENTLIYLRQAVAWLHSNCVVPGLGENISC